MTETLILSEPLSLWGGVDPSTGRIIDVHHPQHGDSIAGKVLVMPEGRGSSSSSSVLAEMIRIGTAPSKLILGRIDPILMLGAWVAEELYGLSLPIECADGPS